MPSVASTLYTDYRYRRVVTCFLDSYVLPLPSSSVPFLQQVTTLVQARRKWRTRWGKRGRLLKLTETNSAPQKVARSRQSWMRISLIAWKIRAQVSFYLKHNTVYPLPKRLSLLISIDLIVKYSKYSETERRGIIDIVAGTRILTYLIVDWPRSSRYATTFITYMYKLNHLFFFIFFLTRASRWLPDGAL